MTPERNRAGLTTGNRGRKISRVLVSIQELWPRAIKGPQVRTSCAQTKLTGMEWIIALFVFIVKKDRMTIDFIQRGGVISVDIFQRESQCAI